MSDAMQELVEHEVEFDVAKEDAKALREAEDLWDQIESTRWWSMNPVFEKTWQDEEDENAKPAESKK